MNPCTSLAVAAAVVAAAVAGCSQPSPTTTPESANGSVTSATSAASATAGVTATDPAKVRFAVPNNFSLSARWTAAVDRENPVLVTTEGIAVLRRSQTVSGFSVVFLDPRTGQPVWTSAPAPVDPDAALVATASSGRPWLLMVWPLGKHEVTVRVYDALAVGSEVEPVREVVFTSPELAKAPPVVIAREDGVLISGTERGDLRFDPATGATVPAPKSGFAATVSANAWLMRLTDGGVGFVSDDGTKVWSTDARDHSVRLLGSGSGFVVLGRSDPGVDDGPMAVSLHRAVDGSLLSTVRVSSEAVDRIPFLGYPVVVSDDASTAVWGPALFRLATGEGAALDIAEETPIAVRQGVVYAGWGVRCRTLDAATARVLSEVCGVAPLGFSATGDGVFLSEGTVYSVPLAQ